VLNLFFQTTEKAQNDKEKGCSVTEKDIVKDELIYKIEIPANRYDLLCGEGIAQGLRVFLEKYISGFTFSYFTLLNT